MLIDLAILGVGLALLAGGGELLVRGATRLAQSVGVSPLVIGLTVVAFGTSAPELAVNVGAALSDSGTLAFGNIFGSNMANIGLIIGCAAMITPLPIQNVLVRRELPMMMLAIAAASAMAFDVDLGETRNVYTRSDGLVFLLFFVVFMYYTLGDLLRRRNGNGDSPYGDLSASAPDLREPSEDEGWVKPLSMSAAGLIALLGGAQLTVVVAVDIARALAVPEVVIGLTMVSVGTSLPELVAALAAIRRRQLDIAVGGIVGSNIFNTLFVAGITATVNPMPIPPGGQLDLGVTAILSLGLMLSARTHRQLIIRTEGAALLVVYLAYIVWRVVQLGSGG